MGRRDVETGEQKVPNFYRFQISVHHLGQGTSPVGDRTRDARPQNSRKHTKSDPLTLNKAR
jgi:hypothetical protein